MYILFRNNLNHPHPLLITPLPLPYPNFGVYLARVFSLNGPKSFNHEYTIE